MTVKVIVIVHIDSNFPLWKIKGKSTSIGYSDEHVVVFVLLEMVKRVPVHLYSMVIETHGNFLHCVDLYFVKTYTNPLYKKLKEPFFFFFGG